MKRGKKKLIFCITKSNWGGAQRYVFDMATSFSSTYDVTVLLGGDGELASRLKEKGIRVVLLPGLQRDVAIFDIAIFFRLLQFFRKEKPDIVHLNSSKIGALGTLSARIARIPRIVFTAHGWAFREERPYVEVVSIKFISWLTIFFSHHTIAVSHYDKKEVSSWPFTKHKVSVIHNAVTPTRVISRKTAWKKITEENILPKEFFKKEGEYLFLVSIGELHPNKGYSAINHAVALLKQRKLNVVHIVFGDGEDRENLESMRNTLNLNEHVYFVGSRPNASELLPAFDIFILPSLKEGFPYATLEAGMGGIPIIASAVGGIPEIITDMETGILVRPKSHSELASAVEFFLKNPQSAQQFTQTLKAKIRTKFSFEEMKQKTANTYIPPYKADSYEF